MISVSEEPPPAVASDPPAEPNPDLSRGDVRIAGTTRLVGTIVGRLADQARQTASAAKARRVGNGGGEPGVLDLTPLQDLFSDLVADLRKLRLRDRIARALRQAADSIDSQSPGH